VRSALGMLGVAGIQIAMLLTFARLWTAYVYTSFFPVYLVDAGLGPALAGTVMSMSGLVSAAVAPSAGFWARRFDEESVAGLGLACGATALVLAPHVTTVPAVFIVPALVGLGQGLSLPLLLSITSAAAPPGQGGVALGLRAMSSQVAAMGAPVVVGPAIAGLGPVLGFGLGGFITGGIILSAHLVHLRDRRHNVQRRPSAAGDRESGRPP
jgi:MFS transporter, DHA1 family, inner membrane transport protein